MAHYALLNEENMVIDVFVGRDEDDLAPGVTDWETYYAPEGFTVRRTSYNTVGGQHVLGGTPLRGNYAGIGYTYLEAEDIFMPPKPFESWVLNTECACWEAPVTKPEGDFEWDESAGEWVVAE